MGAEGPRADSVRDALGDALGSDPGPLELSYVPGGASRETFLVNGEAGRWVLRRDPPGGQSFVPWRWSSQWSGRSPRRRRRGPKATARRARGRTLRDGRLLDGARRRHLRPAPGSAAVTRTQPPARAFRTSLRPRSPASIQSSSKIWRASSRPARIRLVLRVSSGKASCTGSGSRFRPWRWACGGCG